jgi:hypothetical protein
MAIDWKWPGIWKTSTKWLVLASNACDLHQIAHRRVSWLTQDWFPRYQISHESLLLFGKISMNLVVFIPGKARTPWYHVRHDPSRHRPAKCIVPKVVKWCPHWNASFEDPKIQDATDARSVTYPSYQVHQDKNAYAHCIRIVAGKSPIIPKFPLLMLVIVQFSPVLICVFRSQRPAK